MNKKSMTEQEILSEFIRPALVKAGWQGTEVRIREEYFSDGRLYIESGRPLRGERHYFDYLLVYKNVRLAVIEAKDIKYEIGSEMGQAV